MGEKKLVIRQNNVMIMILATTIRLVQKLSRRLLRSDNDIEEHLQI